MPHSIDPSITTPEASTTREAPRAPAVAPIDYPSFRPRAPWWGGDLQTLRNTVMRPRSRLARSTAEGLRFSMADGTGDVLLGLLNRPEGEAAPDKPLAVLVHGLTGCAESSYMLATASALLRRGYGVLRLNLRGAGPSRPLCRQQYHAGRTQDIRAVLAQLPADLTRSGIVLTGYSLDGNVVLKLLGEGTPPGVRAGVSISAPIDLAESLGRIQHPRNWFYHRWLIARMKAEALAGPLTPAEREMVNGIRTCYEFDDRYVAPRNGWSGAEEYYTVNSAKGFLDRIRVPTLIIHALDDPWIPATAYRSMDWNANPCLTPLLPEHGGHVGFHDGQAETWTDQCLVRFLGAGPGGLPSSLPA
jgi:predicted alpha/beta-fold hydrolase